MSEEEARTLIEGLTAEEKISLYEMLLDLRQNLEHAGSQPD